jgi:hypothetical protein
MCDRLVLSPPCRRLAAPGQDLPRSRGAPAPGGISLPPGERTQLFLARRLRSGSRPLDRISKRQLACASTARPCGRYTGTPACTCHDPRHFAGRLAVLLPSNRRRGIKLRHYRRVDGARRVVHEQRLVRRHRLLGLHPVDRLVRHVDGEVVVRHLRWIDLDHAVVDERLPLVRLVADEAVELVEALVGRPAVERPDTLVSRAAVSCRLRKAPVRYPFSRSISARVRRCSGSVRCCRERPSRSP